MAYGRVISFAVGLLVTFTVSPIIGFNVYFNAFKAQYDLEATSGEYFPIVTHRVRMSTIVVFVT